MLNLLKYSQANIASHVKLRSGSLNYFPRFYYTQQKDYYKLLGVSQSANPQEIKAAFYKLAKMHHPDINKSSGDKFKEINEAYETLSDESKKREYDTILKYSSGSSSSSYTQGQNPYSGGTHYNNGGFKRPKANPSYYQQQQEQEQQSHYYRARHRRSPYDDYSQFTQDDYAQAQANAAHKRKVFEEIRRQQEEIRRQYEEQQYEVYEDFQEKLRKKFLWFGGFILFSYVMFYVIPQAIAGPRQYQIYDPTENTVYVTDERTYHEWMRKGQPPIHKFLDPRRNMPQNPKYPGHSQNVQNPQNVYGRGQQQSAWEKQFREEGLKSAYR